MLASSPNSPGGGRVAGLADESQITRQGQRAARCSMRASAGAHGGAYGSACTRVPATTLVESCGGASVLDAQCGPRCRGLVELPGGVTNFHRPCRHAQNSAGLGSQTTRITRIIGHASELRISLIRNSGCLLLSSRTASAARPEYPPTMTIPSTTGSMSTDDSAPSKSNRPSWCFWA